ncbi:MAG: cyclic nucleotide-binding domain-containing protein [Deltaproteobacteria bacterium]|nr:cyclic nucleotide-binding domain-containing protein [Deltaproteobacteria bacterium]
MPATPKTFKAGEQLFAEGEPSTSIFIITKGVVAVRKKKGSAFVEIARLRSNEVLGELSFFDRMPRSATAISISDVEAIEIDFGSLDHIYNSVPPYFKTIMAAVASRLRRANDTIRRLQSDVVQADDLKTLEADTESGGAETGGADIDEVAKILAGNSEPGEEK